MSIPKIGIFLFLCFFFLLLKMDAQTCCSAGAPITSSFDIASQEQQTLAFQSKYEYNSVNRLVSNNERLTNDPRTRNGHNVLFKTDFNLNKQWAFSAFLPVVIQNRSTFSEMESAAGLGDLTLFTQYSTHLKNESEFKFGLGLKLPTGQQYLTDSRGINLSPDMQSGSGTVDFIGRISWLKNHFIRRNLHNQTSLSYRYNTTNEHFGDPEKINGRSFKFGNELSLTSMMGYQMVVNTWFVIPDIGIQWRHTSPNKEQGQNAPNSGGDWFNIPLGVRIQTNEQFSFRVFGEIPVVQNLEGLQITTDYKIGVQIQYQLILKNSLK